MFPGRAALGSGPTRPEDRGLGQATRIERCSFRGVNATLLRIARCDTQGAVIVVPVSSAHPEGSELRFAILDCAIEDNYALPELRDTAPRDLMRRAIAALAGEGFIEVGRLGELDGRVLQGEPLDVRRSRAPPPRRRVAAAPRAFRHSLVKAGGGCCVRSGEVAPCDDSSQEEQREKRPADQRALSSKPFGPTRPLKLPHEAP